MQKRRIENRIEKNANQIENATNSKEKTKTKWWKHIKMQYILR